MAKWMTQKEYNRKLRYFQRLNQQKIMRQKLNEQKNKFKKKKTTASKKALWIMMAIVFEIVVYAQIIMWHFGDFSSLYVLIGIPATMALPLFQYYSKSRAENTAGGITYQLAMREQDRIDNSTSTDDVNDDEGLEFVDLDDESGDNYMGQQED